MAGAVVVHFSVLQFVFCVPWIIPHPRLVHTEAHRRKAVASLFNLASRFKKLQLCLNALCGFRPFHSTGAFFSFTQAERKYEKYTVIEVIFQENSQY